MKTANEVRTSRGSLRRWWPTLAAIGLAGLTALGLSNGRESAPILAASGLVYLGAAALRKPSTAWPVFFGTFVIITTTTTRVVAVDFDATWVFLGLAGLFVGYSLLRARRVRPAVCRFKRSRWSASG
jgi:hypothetical protein